MPHRHKQKTKSRVRVTEGVNYLDNVSDEARVARIQAESRAKHDLKFERRAERLIASGIGIYVEPVEEKNEGLDIPSV